MYENITSKLFELLDEIKNQIAKIEIDEQGNISKVGIDLINKPFKEMVCIKEKNFNVWNENIKYFDVYEQSINEVLEIMNLLWDNYCGTHTKLNKTEIKERFFSFYNKNFNFETDLERILNEIPKEYLVKLLNVEGDLKDDLVNELLLRSSLEDLFIKYGTSLFRYDTKYNELIKRYYFVLKKITLEN